MAPGAFKRSGRSGEKIGQQWLRYEFPPRAERHQPPVGFSSGEVVPSPAEGPSATCSWVGVPQSRNIAGSPPGCQTHAPPAEGPRGKQPAASSGRRGHAGFQGLPQHRARPLASGWALQLGQGARGRHFTALVGRDTRPAKRQQQGEHQDQGRKPRAPIDLEFQCSGMAWSRAFSAHWFPRGRPGAACQSVCVAQRAQIRHRRR